MADMSGGGSKQISNFVAGCLLSSQCGETRFEGEFLAISTISLTRTFLIFTYRKVARSRLSRLVAHPRIFRRLMKGKFDPYLL